MVSLKYIMFVHCGFANQKGNILLREDRRGHKSNRQTMQQNIMTRIQISGTPAIVYIISTTEWFCFLPKTANQFEA